MSVVEQKKVTEKNSKTVTGKRTKVKTKERKSKTTTTASSSENSNKKIGARNKELGRKGEEAASRFLYRRGYEVIERNWKCYAGEADIIAKDGNTLVFVEVKTRRDTQKGFPAEAVSAAKRDKYEKIALEYLSKSTMSDMSVRFDVVSLVVVERDKALIRHHINAFAVTD